MARKANWEESIRSEMMSAEFFKNSMVGLAIFDERLYYQMVNPYLAASNGTPIESHLGKHVREILGSVSLPVELAIQQVFATEQPVLNCEVAGPLPAKPGGGHWIDSFFPIADASGKVRRVGAVVVELEKEQRLEPVRDNSAFVNHVLRSWKDIAQYMGTCVKTVQRWERAYDFRSDECSPVKAPLSSRLRTRWISGCRTGLAN